LQIMWNVISIIYCGNINYRKLSMSGTRFKIQEMEISDTTTEGSSPKRFGFLFCYRWNVPYVSQGRIVSMICAKIENVWLQNDFYTILMTYILKRTILSHQLELPECYLNATYYLFWDLFNVRYLTLMFTFRIW
jgi:hypothetical protein